MSELAVVTGASSGIGRAVALKLASQGYSLLAVGRRASCLGETVALLEHGPNHRWLSADVGDVDGVEMIASHVVDEAERVAVLVHCAGGLVPDGGPSLRGRRDELLSAMALNFVSVALLTEALAPHLVDHRARVIGMSSIAAIRGGGASYGPSKAALHAWTYSTARDLGPRGITVNLVAPGYVADTDFFGDDMSESRHQRLVDQTLVGRAGSPADIAGLVAYLASPDSGYVTGQVLHANGGAEMR